jgi:hypothetical protein
MPGGEAEVPRFESLMRSAETHMGVDGYMAAKAGKLCDLQYDVKRNAVK